MTLQAFNGIRSFYSTAQIPSLLVLDAHLSSYLSRGDCDQTSQSNVIFTPFTACCRPIQDRSATVACALNRLSYGTGSAKARAIDERRSLVLTVLLLVEYTAGTGQRLRRVDRGNGSVRQSPTGRPPHTLWFIRYEDV